MRFFELFIKNKNLIKQGLYLLEIYKNAAGSTDLAMNRRGHDRPSWTLSSHTYAISSASLFITFDSKYDGPSQAQRSVDGLVPKHFNSWNLGTGITSLNFTTNLQDGPSEPRWTVTSFVIPHLVRLPHLPSAAILRCHLRTVTSTTDRHKLRRWSLLHFSLKISAFSFGQISCKTKRNLHKNQHKKAFGHTKFKEKY